MQHKAYAKLNLTLDVLGTAGGYHMLDSLVTTVDLFDTVHIFARGDGVCTVETRGAEILAERNNALRAAERFCEKFHTRGVDIVLEKRIPIGAGMGGSSTDSAAVIAGMGGLFHVNDRAALKALADENGSDTGYLLGGGIARIRGRGERVERFPFQKLYFVVLPTAPVSTGECFAAYDRQGGPSSSRTERAAERMRAGDVAGAAGVFGNDLTSAAQQFADVAHAIERMRQNSPLGAGMTGSGGAVFGLFRDGESAARAREKLNDPQAFVTESIEYRS